MAVVTLTRSNNGESVKLRPEDEIEVQLPENATTGYRWYIERADGLTEIPVQAEISPPDPNPQFGRGGVRKFRFRAEGRTTGRLQLKHWREWEGDSSVLERFAVDFEFAD
jgi:inhibitor of cysteine peptidase